MVRLGSRQTVSIPSIFLPTNKLTRLDLGGAPTARSGPRYGEHVIGERVSKDEF